MSALPFTLHFQSAVMSVLVSYETSEEEAADPEGSLSPAMV